MIIIGYMKSRHLYDLVKDLLIVDATLRDSDKKLMWEVWRREGFIVSGFLNYTSFLDKRFTIPETIRRIRQKVQEKNHHLRSSKPVQDYKNEKRRTKGTFAFREPITYKLVDPMGISKFT